MPVEYKCYTLKTGNMYICTQQVWRETLATTPALSSSGLVLIHTGLRVVVVVRDVFVHIDDIVASCAASTADTEDGRTRYLVVPFGGHAVVPFGRGQR